MKRAALAALTVAALLPAAPAGAVISVGAYADHVHLIEAYQTEGAPVEVWMFAGTGEVLVNADPYAEPIESGGCISLFRARPEGDIAEEACGALEIHPQPLLGGTHLSGSLEGTAYGYVNDPEHGPTFTELGPSTIEVDLTLIGVGDRRLAEPERMGVGVCGLGKDLRGVFAMVHAPVTRAAAGSGSLTGGYVGEVDPSTVFGSLTDSTFATAGACLEI